MRILIVPSWYADRKDNLGTGGIFHYEQAKELAKNNTVAIFYMFDRNLEENFYKREERGILTYRSRFIPSQKIRNRIRIYQAFQKVIKEFKPDIVHVHVATEAGRYTALWCKHFNIPFLVTEHSTVEISGVQKGMAYQYAKFVYGRSAANFCVSEDLCNKLSTIFPKYSFQVVYNGIIIPKQIKQEKIYARKKQYNIGFVAALYDKEIKGLQFLLPAIQELLAKGEKIVLHIVGGGEYENYFQEMAKNLKIEESVIFYGMCSKEKVYAIINQMDFFISASIVESFGCSIAEALLLGKPVVATKCGGPEGYINEQVGVLVEKESEEELYTGIQYMIEHLLEYKSTEIKEYAHELFDNEIICKRYEEVYKVIKNKVN